MKILLSSITQSTPESEIRTMFEPYVGKDLWLECTYHSAPGYVRILALHYGGPNFLFNFLTKSFINRMPTNEVLKESFKKNCSAYYYAIDFHMPLHAVSSEELGLPISEERDSILRYVGKDVWVQVNTKDAHSYFIKIISVNGVSVGIHYLSNGTMDQLLNTTIPISQDVVDYYTAEISNMKPASYTHIDNIHINTPRELYSSAELVATLQEHPIQGTTEED